MSKISIRLAAYILAAILVISGFLTFGIAKPESAKADAGIQDVGWVTIWGVAGNILNTMDWDYFNMVIWQNYVVSGVADPTLRVQNGFDEVSQVDAFVAAAHAHGKQAIACIYGGSEPAGPNLSAIMADAGLRNTLVANLAAKVAAKNLDGIAIDWEAYPFSPSDIANYGSFLSELRAQLGASKIITPIGSWPDEDGVAGAPYLPNIPPSAQADINFVSLMSYDYWTEPAYGSMDMISQTVNGWVSAGFAPSKLYLGINLAVYQGFGWWGSYSSLLQQNPSLPPDENAQGSICWNGPDLIAQKVAWAITAGLGGVWGYETNLDNFASPYSLEKAIWNAASGGGAASPAGGNAASTLNNGPVNTPQMPVMNPYTGLQIGLY